MPPNLPASETSAVIGRRAACRVLSLGLGAGLFTLALAACGLKPKERAPGEKYFWEREDQRSR